MLLDYDYTLADNRRTNKNTNTNRQCGCTVITNHFTKDISQITSALWLLAAIFSAQSALWSLLFMGLLLLQWSAFESAAIFCFVRATDAVLLLPNTDVRPFVKIRRTFTAQFEQYIVCRWLIKATSRAESERPGLFRWSREKSCGLLSHV